MSINSRLDRAERESGGNDEPLIIIVRYGADDKRSFEEMPCTVTANGQTTTYVYGINTVPEHLRQAAGPVKNIALSWGDDDDLA